MSRKWNVWNVDRARQRALVVNEGKQADAEQDAERRNAAAKKLGAESIEFVALPDGQEPFK